MLSPIFSRYRQIERASNAFIKDFPDQDLIMDSYHADNVIKLSNI